MTHSPKYSVGDKLIYVHKFHVGQDVVESISQTTPGQWLYTFKGTYRFGQPTVPENRICDTDTDALDYLSHDYRAALQKATKDLDDKYDTQLKRLQDLL